MVRVGVGRLLKLVCAVEIGLRFWKHLVGLRAPEPPGGPSRVIIGHSQSLVCGCFVASGAFRIR